MNWQPGRQGSGYRKLCLFQSIRLSCDAWLIDYPPGAYVPVHTDPVPGKRHYRLNLLLWGQDNFRGETIFPAGNYRFPWSRWLARRIKLFRPDLVPHSVEPVKSRRLVLSIGWAKS